MKFSQELNDILNLQIMHELKNSNIYSQIESYFEDIQLKNLAEFFRKQSLQEKDHANKFINYVNSRTGGKVTITDIENPNLDLKSVVNVADAFVFTEELTTEKIEEILNLVLESKSYIDQPFISEMLLEQVEEEDSANAFSLKIKNVKDIVLFDAIFEVGD